MFPVKEEFSHRRINVLLKDFEQSFVTYKDNQAQVLSNILFYSNASKEEKTKVYILQKNIAIPSYISNVRWFSFNEIQAALWKYHNVTIKWKGTVSNVMFLDTTKEKHLLVLSSNAKDYKQIGQANFLVEFYSKNKEIRAIVPLYFLPTIKLQNGDEIELLATLKYNEASSNAFLPLVTAQLPIALFAQGFRYLLD